MQISICTNDVMKFQTPLVTQTNKVLICVTNKYGFMNGGQFVSIFDGCNRR